MTENQKRLQESARYIHGQLRNYYNAWEELEQLAQEEGMTLDTKTAELKEKR